MTNYTLQPFSGTEDLQRMQSALAQWIQIQGHNTGYCHVGDVPHRLYNGMRGRYPLDKLVELAFDESGALIGFLFGQPFHNAFDLFIHPAHRGGSTEQALLERVYRQTREAMNAIEREETPVMGDVDEGDTDRAAALTALGFEAGENYLNLTERLLAEPIPEPILPEGFTIRPAAGEHEAGRLAEVHNNSFTSSWTPEIYRDEVMRKPGYDAHREIVVVAPDGRFAAFCIYWLDPINRIGLFEPVGTHREFQRKGLARAMMNSTMRRMREENMTRAMVGHMTNNPASTNLYASLGFQTKYRVYQYKK